jgi:hypothetical protein
MKKRRYERPGYVKLIGVLLLLGAAAQLLQLAADARIGRDIIADKLESGDEIGAFFASLSGGCYMLRSPDAGAWLALALAAVCGAFIIRGANWARLLFYTGYLGVCAWSYISWMMDYPTMIPYVVARMVVLAIFCVALAMQRANYFFTGGDSFFKGRGGGKKDSREQADDQFNY